MRFGTLLLSLLALLLVAAPSAAEQIRIKFSHVVQRETPKGKASEYFKRLVEHRSNNRVLVDIYPEGQLADDHQVIAELKANRIQMAAPSVSKLMDFDPQLQIFDLPFLFRDESHLRRVTDGEVGKRLLTGASKEGLVALTFWDSGFKQLTANRLLTTPADIRGLRMRIEGSNVQKAQFKALGASSKTIPFTQLYAALEAGSVDGQENNLSNIYSQRLFKLQSDLLISNHAYHEYLVLVSEEFWQQVPNDLQVIIKSAIEDAATYAREMAVGINNNALTELRNTQGLRVHVMSPAERELWRKKLQKIYPHFAAVIGKDLIRKAQEEGIR